MTAAAASVKKIRRFRVQPRPASVLRHLRALMGAEAVTSEVEARATEEIDRRRALWDTALLYTTVTPAQSPGWAAELWAPVQEATGLLPAPVAITFFASTLGAGVDAALADLQSAGDDDGVRLLTALATEAADQTVHFAARLIGEEAETEACELSPRILLEDPAGQDGVLALLEAARVSLGRDPEGRLTPRFSRLGHTAWRPPAKKRR